MNFLRKSAVVSLTSLLTVLLFGIAFDVGVLHTVGNSGGVKKVLADSGLYNNVVPNALGQIKQLSTSNGDIPLNDPKIQAAANAALTPTEVQTDVNQIIDGTFDWLNGKTDSPSFNIDLSGVQASFADKVAAVVQTRAASLPACTTADQASFDAYNSTCLPPGVTPDQVADQVRSQVQSGKGLLGQTTLSADSIKGSNGDKSVFDQQQIPKTYQKIKTAPIIASVLAILTAVGIVFLSSSRFKGIRRVGYVLVGVGLFMMLFAYSLNKITANKLIPNIKLDNAVTQKEFRNVVTDIEQAIDKNYWTFGITYAVLGAGAWAGTEYLSRRQTPRPQPAKQSQKTDVSG